MKMKFNSFFALIGLSLLVFALSFSIVSVIEFSQVKKEYSSLNFIPSEAELVVRLDAKQLGKDFVKRILISGKSPLFTAEKTSKQLPSTFHFSSVDWIYPVYLFLLKSQKEWATVTVFSINNKGGFVGKSTNEPYQHAFEFNDKGFLVSGCSKESFLDVKRQIESRKSTNWNALVSKKESIAFQSSKLKLSGIVYLKGNDFVIESELNYLNPTRKIRKFLQPNGFHLSTILPQSTMGLISSQLNKFVDVGSYPSIESVSLNYFGIKPPYFPQFQLLVNTDQSNVIPRFIQENNLATFNDNGCNIQLGELTVTGKEIDAYTYSLSTVPEKKMNYSTTEKLGNIQGDLNKLIQFDNAPMLRMLLLLNSKSAAITQFIEKTKGVSLQSMQDKDGKKQRIVFKIEMKPAHNFLDEIILLLKSWEA